MTFSRVLLEQSAVGTELENMTVAESFRAGHVRQGRTEGSVRRQINGVPDQMFTQINVAVGSEVDVRECSVTEVDRW